MPSTIELTLPLNAAKRLKLSLQLSYDIKNDKWYDMMTQMISYIYVQYHCMISTMISYMILCHDIILWYHESCMISLNCLKQLAGISCIITWYHTWYHVWYQVWYDIKSKISYFYNMISHTFWQHHIKYDTDIIQKFMISYMISQDQSFLSYHDIIKNLWYHIWYHDFGSDIILDIIKLRISSLSCSNYQRTLPMIS